MTLLQWCALVGIPLILLAGGYAATRLAAHDARQAARLGRPRD